MRCFKKFKDTPFPSSEPVYVVRCFMARGLPSDSSRIPRGRGKQIKTADGRVEAGDPQD